MGNDETFKGGVHGVLGGMAAAFCLYNLMAFGQSRQARNAVNVGLYAALWAYENVQAHYHWSKRDAA